MPSRKIESHPDNPAYFVSCTDRLNLFEIGGLKDSAQTSDGNHLRYRSVNLKSSRPLAGLTCMDWCRDESKPRVLGFGTNKGDVFLLNWDRNTETKISSPTTIKRQCTDIAWGSSQSNKLAVGYEKARGELAVVVYEISPYDINFQSPRATAYPAFSDTAASLAWVPHSESLLAVGTMAGWIRVHDARSGNLADMNILAHTDPKHRRVKGIRFDPFNDHVFATFSDVGNEPVKIWDLRKVEKSKDPRVLTIDPMSYLFNDSTNPRPLPDPEEKPRALISQGVIDIEWSTTRQDVLAVATTHDPRVLLYSTCRPSNAAFISRTPVAAFTTGAISLSSLSWMKKVPEDSIDPSDIVTSKNRLLVGTDAGVLDICVVDDVPLAMSCGWSPSLFAVGSGSVFNICTSPSTISSGCSGGEDDTAHISTGQLSAVENEDDIEPIEQTMLSMCKSGYSVDAGKNIQVIADKLDLLASTSPASFTRRAKPLLQLQRVWCWVDRVESMSILDPSLSLQNCGVLQLLQSNEASLGTSVGGERDALCREVPMESMPCCAFESPSRKAARSVCGWATLKISSSAISPSGAGNVVDPHEARYLDLEDLTEEYIKYDSFERACALALWHGNINLAVAVLQRAIDKLSVEGISTKATSPSHLKRDVVNDEYDEDEVASAIDLSHISLEYFKLISLVAMCLAGFPKSSVNIMPNSTAENSSRKNAKKIISKSVESSTETTSLWSTMCIQLVSQLRQISERSSVGYLVGACEFLLSLLEVESASKDEESPPSPLHSLVVRKYSSVLFAENLAVEDRCGFACTYLPTPDLIQYLRCLQASCLSDCDIEGVILMGLNAFQAAAGGGSVEGMSATFESGSSFCGGIQLLQKYLDSRCDIQTVALLVSRLPHVLLTSPRSEYSIEGEWLTTYRSLLNRWKLFIERASLDVELGKRFRQMKAHVAAAENIERKASGAAASGSYQLSDASKVVYPLPNHMDDEASHMCMKCTYCSVALPVDPMDKKHAGSVWLRRQRPLLNCCPNCKKPLPRCYVCLFFTSVLNPQMELKVIAKRRDIVHDVAGLLTTSTTTTPEESGIQIKEKLSTLETMDQNLFDRGRWFMWCQRCKHGGHAGCLDKWFSGGRRICGVNGCSCNCSMTSLEN